MTIKTAGGLLTASARGEGGGFALVPVLRARSLHSALVGKKAARANSKIPTNAKKQHKRWFCLLRFPP